MAVVSTQISGLIAGQQAMFGNYASYAQQISPYGGGGVPTYYNPMEGYGGPFVPPPPPTSILERYSEEFGTRALGALTHVPTALTMVSFGTGLAGSLLKSPTLGAISGATSVFDPFSAALRGFGRGIGWQSGLGISGNLTRFGSMGGAQMLRAGLTGLGMAGAYALPALLATKASEYAIGQMVEGAQFQEQVGGTLQHLFRMPRAGGYGFTQLERHDIGNLLREMGHREMLSTPSEMLRIMHQGFGMGAFRAVQDAREFKQRFQDLTATLKEVAKIMNTSLEGAMPFLAQARQQGFWTPQDIVRQAAMARGAAAVTGLTVAQTQAVMGYGAQLSRAIGGSGQQGAVGMHRALVAAGAIVGGPGRPGLLTEAQIAELTGGLQGPEAAQALAMEMQEATTRFARSTHGRWILAALGTDRYRRLDPQRMREFLSGRMRIGEVSEGAYSGISRQGAFSFVANEERLRGELAEQGPWTVIAAARQLAGSHLFDESDRSRYIVRRMLERFGITDYRRQDLYADLARRMPQIIEQMSIATQRDADARAIEQKRVMEQTWQGVSRQIGKWWKQNVDEPLQRFGSELSLSVSRTVKHATNAILGGVERRFRVTAPSTGFGRAMYGMAMGTGDAEGYLSAFRGLDTTLTAKPEGRALSALRDLGYGWREVQIADPYTAAATTDRIKAPISQETFEDVVAAMRTVQGGGVSERGARGLGFASVGAARQAIESGRAILSTTENRLRLHEIAARTGATGTDLLRAYTREARAGRLGEEMRALTSEVSEEVAHLRVGAVLPEAQRREAVRELSERIGAGEIIFASERDLQKQGLAAEKALARRLGAPGEFSEWVSRTRTGSEVGLALFGGPIGVGAALTSHVGRRALIALFPKVTQETIARLREGHGKLIDEAFLVLGNPKATAEEKESVRRRLLDLLDKDPKMSKDKKEVILQLASGKLDASPELQHMARMVYTRDVMSADATVKTRFSRIRDELGEQYDRSLRVLATGGGAMAEIATTFRELESANLQTEEGRAAFVGQLQRLSDIAAKASPEERARLERFVAEMGRSEATRFLTLPISRALEAGAGAKAAVGGGRKGLAAAAQYLGDVGISLTRQDYQKLARGDRETIERLLQGIAPEERDVAREMLLSLGMADKAAAAERFGKAIRRTGSGAAVRSAFNLDTADQIKQWVEKAKGGEVFGRPGSAESMYAQATLTNKLLREIKDKLPDKEDKKSSSWLTRE